MSEETTRTIKNETDKPLEVTIGIIGHGPAPDQERRRVFEGVPLTGGVMGEVHHVVLPVPPGMHVDRVIVAPPSIERERLESDLREADESEPDDDDDWDDEDLPTVRELRRIADSFEQLLVVGRKLVDVLERVRSR